MSLMWHEGREWVKTAIEFPYKKSLKWNEGYEGIIL